MNPLLQGVQDALKGLQFPSVSPPAYKPPAIPATAAPDMYKQAGDLVKPVVKNTIDFTTGALGLVNEGFDYIDKIIGGISKPISQEMIKLSTGDNVDLPQRATEQIGFGASKIFGEGFRLPAEIGASFLLPPFGIGSLGKLPKAVELTKFAEEAAKATKAEDIALMAEKAFPGIPKETALNLGKQFAPESDSLKILDALRPSTAAAAKERGFVESVRKELPGLEPAINATKTTYIPRATEPLAIAAQNLVRDNPTEAALRAVQQTNDESIAIASELLKRYDAQALQLEKAGSVAEANAIRDEAARLTNQVAKNLTEAGRYVQAASILGKQTPEGIARFAARTIQKFNETAPLSKQLPELSGELRKQLVDEWKRIQGIENADEKAAAVDKFMQKVSDLVPSSWYQRVISVWKAGLLTGLKTSGLNVLSNTSHAITELVKEIPASIVERSTYAVTGGKFGKPTIALTARGFVGGAAEGFQKGARYLKTGYNERDMLSKFDVKRVNFGTSPMAKAIQRYEETVFRFIGAQDMPFYYGAKARSITSQAIASGKGLGLKGAELEKYVKGLLENPPDQMVKYATYDAEVAVFQNSTALAKVGQALQRAGAEFMMPFARTPAAVAMQVINYSPAGVVAEIGRQIHRGNFDQRLFSQAMGRAITGTGIMYLGTLMHQKNLLALTYPQSATDRNQWELEGKVPNSINVDGNWRSAAVLGPGGLVLLLGGIFDQAYHELGSPTGAMIQATAALGTTLTEQTFLKGTNEFTAALTDPYANGISWFSGVLGSIVPTVVSDVAQATDPYQRRTNEGAAGGVFGRLESRIPGVREQLQPKVTSLGTKVPTADWWQIMFDPTRPSKETKDPAVLELKRLQEVGFNATPTKLGTTKSGYASLTPQQNTDLWILEGDLLHTKLSGLIQMPGYKELTDEKKQKVIQQFSEIAKRETRAQFIHTVTQGLSGTALLKKLAEFKRDKLLTQDVFTEYLKFSPNLQ